MPRRKKPQRRQRDTGSISVNKRTGAIRARVPATIDPRRPSREFRPGQMAEARAWLAAQIEPPAASVRASVTLADWAGEWWETYVAPIRPPNTAKWYLYALRQLDPCYALPVEDVRTSTLQAVVGAISGRLDPASVQGIAGVWRRCLDAAIDDGLILRNPARRLILPKVLKRPEARYVTADEVALLRPAIRGRRFEAAFALMLGCGLRIGEILGLRWESVDFDRHRIWVGPQFTNGHWRSEPKAHNPHHVPMPPDVEAALRRHQMRQAPGRVLVFESPYRGKLYDPEHPRPWSAQIVRRELVEIVAMLGLDDLTPHAGRHGLASHLMSRGVSPVVIAERLGNTPAVVLNRYSHANDDERKRADALVDDYLGGAEEPETGPEGRVMGAGS